jgi:hypothetical protein
MFILAHSTLSITPDHRGPFFKQVHAKLVQHDIRHINTNLIRELYDKLRPGTLVLVNITLYCWIIVDNDTKKDKNVCCVVLCPTLLLTTFI